jgi:hypothetical protein
MSKKLNRSGWYALFVLPLLLLVIALSTRHALAQSRGPGSNKQDPVGPTALTVQDLTGPLTAQDLADALAGEGVTVSNVTYVGSELAVGAFNGGTGIIGFESGILLGTGSVVDVIGPNEFPDVTTDHFTAGDADLDLLVAPNVTMDAAVLEFDFVPAGDAIFFHYVFSSDEYNEFVGSDFNDVFGFYVNGVNCAVVGDTAEPVTINTINNGFPYGEPPVSHPELYRNNDPFDSPEPATIDTEMDGLTVVLNCGANVNPNVTNHMKLAVADTSDTQYDTNVFLEGGSLTTEPTDVSLSSLDGASGGPVALIAATAALLAVLALALLTRRRTAL